MTFLIQKYILNAHNLNSSFFRDEITVIPAKERSVSKPQEIRTAE
jgi:hypothetical protein